MTRGATRRATGCQPAQVSLVRRLAARATACLMVAWCTTSTTCARAATAPLPPAPPPGLDGVGIAQNLGARVPGDLSFTDESGRAVRLGDYFGRRPVILTPVYYKCPMLCTMTLNDLTRSMNGLTESAGTAFDVVTFSFDPREGPALAAEKKRQYVRSYGRPTADAGWHFLTGNQSSIRALTDAIGFSYRYDAANDVYAHVAGVVVLTPDGTISRYFLGTVPAVDLRDALRDAAAAKVAPPAAEVFLYCFRYDPATGRYGLIVTRALQVMAVLTVLLLAGFVGWNLKRERRRRRGDIAGGPRVARQGQGPVPAERPAPGEVRP